MEVMLPEDIRNYIESLPEGSKKAFAIHFALDNPDCGLETVKQAVIDGND
jgi:hypothetical protein